MALNPNNSLDAHHQHFATTQWSIVLAAANHDLHGSRDALAKLCEVYWYPLYAYVRRRVNDVHAAQDLTQAFFSKLLEKNLFAAADRDRGRFRAFLLTAFKNFLKHEWEKADAEKRGGGKMLLSLDFDSAESRYSIEPFHDVTPEKLFERRWVLTLLDQVLQRLQRELIETGKSTYFDQLKQTIAADSVHDDYAQAAEVLGITPAATKQAAYRMRKRYRELFREEVARTIGGDEDLDEEIGRLLKFLE